MTNSKHFNAETDAIILAIAMVKEYQKRTEVDCTELLNRLMKKLKDK